MSSRANITTAYAVTRPPGPGQDGDRVVLPLDVTWCDGETVEGYHHVRGAMRSRQTYTLDIDAFASMRDARDAAARASDLGRMRGKTRCVMPEAFQSADLDYVHGQADGIATLSVTSMSGGAPIGLAMWTMPRYAEKYAPHAKGRFEDLLRETGLAWSHEGIVQPRWTLPGGRPVSDVIQAIRAIGSLGRVLTYAPEWLGCAETIILLPRADGRVEAASVFAASFGVPKKQPMVGIGAFDIATLDIGWAQAQRLKFPGALRLLCGERPIPEGLAAKTNRFSHPDPRLGPESKAMAAALALDDCASGQAARADWEAYARLDATGAKPEVRMTTLNGRPAERPFCALVAEAIASSPAADVRTLGHRNTYMKRRPIQTRLSSYDVRGDDVTFAKVRAPASATLRAALCAGLARGPRREEAIGEIRRYLSALGGGYAERLDAIARD